MDNKPTAPLDDDSNGLETLEDTSTQVESPVADGPAQTVTTSEPTVQPAPGTPAPKPPRRSIGAGIKHLGERFNVYLIIFVFVLVLAAGLAVVAYLNSKKSSNTANISTQTLDQKALEQLANTDTTVGSSSQVLKVQSNAIFAGKVLVRDTLEVAGGLQIGGSLSLAGVTVSGSSSFGQVQVTKNLAVLGDSALQGQVTIQKGLSVNGNGVFNGSLSATQITTSALQLNGELTLTHHITAGGATPSRSNGSALGSGGTASVSGSDTSGSISINTGGSPSAGCFITVTFASKYNATPHVLITPVGSAAGSIAYYVNRSTSNFSICAADTPPANANFGYDYFILD
ncbi:MAG TPA: hypothetical protein VFI84_01490 [Candidatus Saccharimonadales bacterium]|nr:hypothetical protein [Candidatus Saccharimonadales bacterium]